MNIPYIKEYNKDGECTNPLRRGQIYRSEFPNRKQRRETRNRVWGGKAGAGAFHGNGKNLPLTVNGAFKFLRVRQVIIDKSGNKKTVEHYHAKGKNY